MGSDSLPFPKNPGDVLRQYGEMWMSRAGVKGVGLAMRDRRLKFVILATDPKAVADVPPSIGGYPTAVELPMARAASGPKPNSAIG